MIEEKYQNLDMPVYDLYKVVDTNVLIDYYDELQERGKEVDRIVKEGGLDSKAHDVTYVIPALVLDEMDKIEHETRDKGLKYNIRKAKNVVREIVDNRMYYPGIEFTKTPLLEGEHADDKLIQEVIDLRNSKEAETELLTIDTLLYIRAKLKLEKEPHADVKLLPKNESRETYKELRYNPVINLNPEEHEDEITSIYQNGRLPDSLEMVNGQYLEIADLDGEVKDQYRYEEGSLVKIPAKKMRVKDFTTVKPKNSRQNLLIDLLENEDKPVKLITGAQGVGKTYFSLLYAFNRLQEEHKRIIWMRPTVYVRGTQDIGALPGDLDEKLEVMYAPAKDILSEHVVHELVEDGEFCVEHLGYDRGRSFTNATILVTECQNLTEDNVHFILGRVGEGTEIIFDGDYLQSDIGHPTGLLALDNKLAGNDLFGKVELPDTVRSEVAKLTQLFEQ